MSAADLEDLYRRWLTGVWGEGRYELVDGLFSEGVIDHNAAPGQPPGRDGQAWAARMLRDAFPDLAFTADVVMSNGELVTGRWTMTGTNTGPNGDARPAPDRSAGHDDRSGDLPRGRRDVR